MNMERRGTLIIMQESLNTRLYNFLKRQYGCLICGRAQDQNVPVHYYCVFLMRCDCSNSTSATVFQLYYSYFYSQLILLCHLP